MNIGIVRYPGTNCDRDTWQAVEEFNGTPKWLWHGDRFNPSEFDGIIIPGGFSYGDYLRSGALAAKSPVMNDIIKAAKLGTPILGICNGFQVLCETHLLPGTLMKNEKMRFIDKIIKLNVVNKNIWTKNHASINIPIAHGDGRYFVTEEELKKIKDDNLVWCEYDENPNGSVENIAGITMGNVSGLMPHPERALYSWMGSEDGRGFFQWLI